MRYQLTLNRIIIIANMLVGAARADGLPAASQESLPTKVAPMTINRTGDRLTMTFSGTLQWAEAIIGPWIDLTNAVSPLDLDPNGSQRFYRVREPAMGSIFASRSIVAWTLSGPFQTNFDLAFAGTPDGIFPPRREKPYFLGTLTMPGYELPVSLRVRGNSSLQECPFPKLKLKVSKQHRAGTPFFDAREIKIGTHCAEGGRGNIGRLRDETATFREALAYETLSLMGFIAPRVRRAQIEYRDTTPTNSMPFGGWQISREALILEDIEVVAERLGGRALSEEEIATLTDAAFDKQQMTELQLFHALVGNWDYALWTDGRGLWNMDVIEGSGGKLSLVAGDFDLASWVTGVVRSDAPRDYHPELGDIERRARYEVEQIQTRTSQPGFTAASQRFTKQRSTLEVYINSVQIDAAGRSNALHHVTAFFDALAAVTQERLAD